MRIKRDWNRDPCNAYNDINKINCALCSPNLLRIFYNIDNEYDATSGSYINYVAVLCGSVRSPNRDPTTHAYTYMNPATVTQDEFASGTYQCYYHYGYGVNDTLTYINTLSYYPQTYLNKTDGFTEKLCVRFDDWIDPETCSQTGVTPTQTYIDTLTADENAIQSTVINMSVGCNYCETNFIPHIIFDETFGLFIQECQRKDVYDYTKADVPCANLGYIQQWTGYIISE